MAFFRSKGALVALAGFGLLIAACGSTRPAPAESRAEVAPKVLAQAEPAAAPAPHACGEQGCSCGSGDAHAACGGGESGPAACGGSTREASQGSAAAASSDTRSPELLTRIDASQVCMVRNHFMGRPQLSVAVEGGTYYGCCAGCANRLLQDPNARVAVDPVSHNRVDKAVAVLAKTERGQVLYFENEQTLSAFRAGFN